MWLAPEIMRNQKYTEKSDIYSVGVVYWEILSRRKFFAEVSFLSVIEDLVLQGKRPAVPECDYPDFVALITDCWHDSPGEYPCPVLPPRSVHSHSDPTRCATYGHGSGCPSCEALGGPFQLRVRNCVQRLGL